MATIYQRAVSLKLRFTQKQYCIIGKKVIEKFREIFTTGPNKVKVERVSLEGKPFYWMCADYEKDFWPVVDTILRESALQIKNKKKRPRITTKKV